MGARAHARLRGCRRGALALVLGAFRIVAGVESVHYASTIGASGDDYTGLLSIPAGLALLVVAPSSGGYLITHLGRAVVPEPRLGAAHDDVSFTTADGAAVSAFPGRSGPAAARSHARPSRLRRAALRPPRRGRERGRSQLARLGRRARRERRDRVPARAARRGRGRSVGQDLDTPGSRWLSPQAAISAAVTAGVAVFSGQASPPNLKELVPRIAPRPLFLIHSGIATERLADASGGVERRVVGFFDAALLR